MADIGSSDVEGSRGQVDALGPASREAEQFRAGVVAVHCVERRGPSLDRSCLPRFYVQLGPGVHFRMFRAFPALGSPRFLHRKRRAGLRRGPRLQ